MPSTVFNQLLPLQKQGVEFATSVDGALLLFEQRTGKTYITGGVIERLDALEVLIVAPKTSLRPTWAAFIEKYLPEWAVFFTWEEYRDHQVGFKRAWDHFDHAVLLINYEALPAIIKKARRRKWHLIVYDEVQRLRSRNSRNSRKAKQLIDSADHRLGLTGTPMDQDPIEMWGIMRFIEPTALGMVWKNFANQYCDSTGYKGYTKVFREEQRPQFLSAVSPYCMRITQEDMGIERATVTRVPVQMFGRQARIYSELEEHMIVEIGRSKVKAPLRITQIGKLQQVTGGAVIDDAGMIRHVGDAKLRRLRHLLSRTKPPVAIFCKFKHEVEMVEEVAREFSTKVAVLWGDVKDSKRNQSRTNLLQAFQAGEYDYIVCQQRTGGVAVDLFAARTAIVYSMNHSNIDFEQMLARLTWLSQESVAHFFLLYVIMAIDEDILTALDTKRAITEVTLERLKRRLRYGESQD